MDIEERKRKQRARYLANRELYIQRAKERYNRLKQPSSDTTNATTTDIKAKNSKKVYLYLNKEYIGEFNSIQDAAKRCGVSYETLRCAYNKGTTIKDGFLPSKTELSEEEIQNLSPSTDNKTTDEKKEWTVKPSFADNIEYKVHCKDKLVCHLERARDKRVDQLKSFIWNKMWDRWTTINPKLATLEKQFVNEITDSLR